MDRVAQPCSTNDLQLWKVNTLRYKQGKQALEVLFRDIPVCSVTVVSFENIIYENNFHDSV